MGTADQHLRVVAEGDRLEVAFSELFPTISNTLPFNDPDTGKVRPWAPPTAEKFNEIVEKSDRAEAPAGEAAGYIIDFQRAMQNLLLGDLFEHRVEPRTPLDPKIKVVTLEEYDALRAYFENDTPWGKSQAKAVAMARAELAKRQKHSTP